MCACGVLLVKRGGSLRQEHVGGVWGVDEGGKEVGRHVEGFEHARA